MAENEQPIRTEEPEVKGTTDPFASQRETGQPATNTQASSPKVDRNLSLPEWDASKTPPSRFQQRKGSIFSTPGSRDGHVHKNTERDAAYHSKLAEKSKGFGDKIVGKFRRASKDKSSEDSNKVTRKSEEK
jgi:hypothetical protein